MLLRLGLRAASWPPSPRLGFAIHTKKTIAAHYDAPMTPQRRACPVADKKHDQHGNEYTDAPFRRAADGDRKPCKAENGGNDGCNRASSTHFAAGSTRSASSRMTWRSVSRARDSSCSWNPVHERVANPRMRMTLSRSDRILSARPAVLAIAANVAGGESPTLGSMAPDAFNEFIRTFSYIRMFRDTGAHSLLMPFFASGAR